jgi:hypothetical protein
MHTMESGAMRCNKSQNQGMIPLGKGASGSDEKQIDSEPFSPDSKPQEQEVGRLGPQSRPCNVIDMGFRNEAGFPLSVYYANNLLEVPDVGFNCAEKYHFHMGLKAAPQGAFVFYTQLLLRWIPVFNCDVHGGLL